ncbi:MAG: hypothetical protein ACIAS6_09570 [Phycisphaerales bacterium JB060]
MASTDNYESEHIPEDIRDLAERLRSLPGDAPEGLESRTFEASVSALRDGRANRGGVLAKIGPVRWMAPIAAAAAVGLLAWAGATWMAPATTTGPEPSRVTTVAFDEHVSEALEYADLFADASWTGTLSEDAETLDEAWEPTVESWSFDSDLGAG